MVCRSLACVIDPLDDVQSILSTNNISVATICVTKHIKNHMKFTSNNMFNSLRKSPNSQI